MTAAGDQVLAYAYSQVGVTENPPNSNICSPYTDAWGAGAWCAMFVSYCADAAGYPLPPIDGPAGFSYVPNGQIAAYTTGHDVGEGGVEPGDVLCFSWEPWHMEGGIAICSSGVYAGAPAGDHTGFFAGWLGGGYMRTVEGNTSQSSWDNGGAVMERTDRYTGQICSYGRHAALDGGGSGTGELFTVGQYEDIMSKLGEVIVRTDWILKACHKCRMVEAKGRWWITDFINVTPVNSPDAVVMLQQLGYLDNDLDAGGNPIPQGCPDPVFDTLHQF